MHGRIQPGPSNGDVLFYWCKRHKTVSTSCRMSSGIVRNRVLPRHWWEGWRLLIGASRCGTATTRGNVVEVGGVGSVQGWWIRSRKGAGSVVAAATKSAFLNLILRQVPHVTVPAMIPAIWFNLCSCVCLTSVGTQVCMQMSSTGNNLIHSNQHSIQQ